MSTGNGTAQLKRVLKCGNSRNRFLATDCSWNSLHYSDGEESFWYYEPRMFISVLIMACHWALFWVTWII